MTPQILTRGSRAAAARSARVRARGDEGPGGGGRVRGAHERLADEGRVEARWPASGRWCAVSRTPDSAMTRRSPGTRSRSRTARSGSTSSVRRSRLLIPIRRAPVARAALDLAGVVRLDERLQAQVPRRRHEPGEALRRVQHRQQEHEVGPGSPEEVELPGIDDELLGQDGHGDGRAHGAQVGHGPAEPVGLAQDGDGGGAAGGVGTGARDGVVTRGDGAGGRASERLTSATRWRPGAASASDDGPRGGRGGDGARPARRARARPAPGRRRPGGARRSPRRATVMPGSPGPSGCAPSSAALSAAGARPAGP